VNRYKRYIPIIAVVLIALGVNLEKFGIDLEGLVDGGNSRGNTPTAPNNSHSSHPDYDQWSSTKPNLNLWHVFEGEINRGGKPVGFHARPGGIDPANARLLSVRDKPNRLGVYTATISIRDGEQWKEKFSSFFPDAMSKDDIVKAVLNAYKNSGDRNAQPWDGPSGLGFRIQGYTSSRGGINTAFPVFVRNP
jgi:hypothetical protein